MNNRLVLLVERVGNRFVLSVYGMENQFVPSVGGVGNGFVLLVGVRSVVSVEGVSVGLVLWLRTFVLLCQE